MGLVELFPFTHVTCIQFVAATQPITALAFIFDGLHYGMSDFPYAACSMVSKREVVLVKRKDIG